MTTVETTKSTKKGYKTNVENVTLENDNFRSVLYTGTELQLVLMKLLPEEEIGLEIHKRGDQFFRFEQGTGKVVINETEYMVTAGDGIIVPMGSKHNIINTSKTDDLKLYTIYAPPQHKDKTIRETKLQAELEQEIFDGKTTELN